MSKKGQGVSSEDMKKYGRNLAKVYNQIGGSISKLHKTRAINQIQGDGHAGRKSGGRGR